MDKQQLIKKNQSGGYQDIYPKTFIDAIRDKESGISLSDILNGFNMYFLPYVGNPESTRLLVPKLLRRQGLWITYVKYDKTVVTEWYAGEDISDTAWKDSSNWRIGNNNLVGDITISSDGNWVVNGENTGVKAQGEPGITPLLQIQDNKLQVSYTKGTTWNTISDYIAAWFRMSATSASTVGDKICTIQISRDEGKTWSNLGESFTNSLHIKDYVSSVGSLPSGAANGDIYGVGPTYDTSDSEHTNPIYNLYVKTSSGWVDNGRFTSISAGIVQNLGESTTEVMSQKALSDYIIETGNSNTVALLAKNGVFYSLTNVATLAPLKYGYYEIRFIINEDNITNQVILDLGSDLNNWWGIRIYQNNLDFLYYDDSNNSQAKTLLSVSDYIGKEVTIRIEKVFAPNEGGDALYLYVNGVNKFGSQDWKDIDFAGVASLGALHTGVLPCTNTSILYFNIYDKEQGTYTLYNSSTIINLSNKLYSIKDLPLMDSEMVQAIIDRRGTPYLHTNGTTSKLRFSDCEGISTSLGRIDTLLRIPTNVTDNRMLFSWGSSFMVNVNLGKLSVYNTLGGNSTVSVPITSYVGKVIELSIRKIGTVSSPNLEIYIDGTLVASSNTYTPETTQVTSLDIGSYNLEALFCDVDFYLLRKYNSNDEIIWEVNANKVASIYEDVSLHIGNTEINTITPPDVPSYLSTVPSTLYVTSNKEYNLYIDNLIIDYSKLGMSLEVKGPDNVIRSMDRNIRFNMPNAGTTSLTFTLYDSLVNIIEEKIVSLQTTLPTAGTGTKQFLFVGDSTIDDALMVDGQPYYGFEGPQIVHEFYDMCNNNKGFTPLMIGHKRDYPPYYHAGMSGWNSADFLNSSSPFWYNGKNDFKHYVQTQIATIDGAVDRVDFMIYQIGINDLKNENGDVTTLINNVKTFINQFLADYPDAKVIIGIPASGNDATGWSVHFFDWSRFMLFRKKMIEYHKEILTTFDNGAYNANVFVCNAGQMIDRIYGFPYKLEPVSSRITTQVMQHWDSVHPDQVGYNQMADGYFGRIKALV